MSAWRSEGDVQSPRLPNQVFVLLAKPALLASTLSFTELYDHLATGVLVLVVRVGIDLADELINSLFDQCLQVDILDPRYRNV